MKNRLIALCLLLAGTMVVRANGDPVAIRSALTLSPTPVAVHIPEVQLVDEAVFFAPRDRYMEVTVRYVLHNRSSRSFEHLPYGFPVDYWGQGQAHWEDIDDIFESQMEKGWRDNYIRDVSFTLGDHQLSWQCSKDTLIVPPEPYISEAYFDTSTAEGRHEFDSLYALYGDSVYSYTHEISRRWYYTYLDIPANSFVTLEVRYTVECNLEQGLYSYREYLTDDESIWYHHFQYDFSPAAYWGNGFADRFNVVFDTSEIRHIRLHGWIKGLGNLGDSSDVLPFQQKGHRWTYTTNHFDLANAKPFSVAYRLKKPVSQPLGQLLNHRMSPDSYTVTVSGADPKYPVANLSDLDPSTTTVLRPNKQDSLYITIRFKEPTSVDALLLLNGYTKNADTWRNNARIDSLLVTDYMPGWLYRDHETDEIKYVDYRPDQRKQMLFGRHEWIKKFVGSLWLPEKYPLGEPEGYDIQSLVNNALIITTGDRWSSNLITEIQIRITAIAKGLKYDDLCVSEILLIRR